MPAIFDHPVLGRGFRPFFLLGALYAVLIVPIWVLQFRGHLSSYSPFADPVLWHGHEMIFGFTAAIIAGFLLTAVANWTGGAPVRQIYLALLCCIWLAGRAAMNSTFSYVAAATIDLMFIPALAVSLAIPLLKTRNAQNFIFLGLLAVLFFCDVWLFVFQDRTALYFSLLVVAAMISLISGRIIPSFTAAALRMHGEKASIMDQPKLDVAALFSLVFLGTAWIFLGTTAPISALLAFAAATIHLWRMRVWHTGRALKNPLVWILHAGYLWLAVSLALFGVSVISSFIPLSVAIHALTAGAIGSMTIGMMMRVALGHTGRELKLGAGSVLAFLLIQTAAITRVILPVWDSSHYLLWLEISSGLWAAAYILYLLLYAPILWGREKDDVPS